MKKLTILCLILSISLIFVSCRVNKDNYQSSVEFFDENEDELSVIVNFLFEYDVNSIVINDDSGNMLIFETIDEEKYLLEKREVEICDDDVIKAIERVFANGCESIYADEVDCLVKFQLVSSFDYYAGIIFSTDIEHAKRVSISDYTLVSDNIWFYYQTDYSK